ncbi:MAG: DOMON-like domain-containing protein [Caulobacter sp.]|nr:DOMON-like domain-containing protein [Caulobacter sp.]
MTVRLTPHPDTPCQALDRIEVNVARDGSGGLALRFVATGDISRLRMPPPVTRARTDELWKHACFEAFVKPAGGEAYWEFNLSPSNRWAGYRFDGYRDGMTSPPRLALRHLTQRASASLYELVATLDLTGGPAFDQPWRLGLSAVIEETTGARSYWALAHAPGKPDFHHPDAFALDLPA